MNNKNHTLCSYRYFNRVYGFDQLLDAIRDKRTNPTIPLGPTLASFIVGLMSGLYSFNALEEAIRDGDFNKFIRNAKLPSADGYADIFTNCNTDDLEELSVQIVQKARHNKALNSNTIEGWKVVGIDGFHSFTMRSERLGEAAHRHTTENKDGTEQTEYREFAVGASYIGSAPRLMLKIKRVPQGEGELTAAKRLVDELNADYYQYCDVIAVDSLYANAPFINTVLENKKEVIARIKQEKTDLIRDAEGLFKKREPDHIFADVTPKDEKPTSGIFYDLEIWDEEDLESWDKVKSPLRVLKIKECRKEINAAGEKIKKEEQVCYFLTTLSINQMKSFLVWKIAHRRWDEENSHFHWLKTYWNLDRRYSHKPEVIQVVYILFVIAFNLFHLYLYRNLRSFEHTRQTKKGFIRKFYRGLVRLTEYLYSPTRSPG